MKQITAHLLTCALTITCNSFGMEKEAKQPITAYDSASFDVIAGLEENNKLLHQIIQQNKDLKRQNRAIIEQNNLSFQIQHLHTALCAPRTTTYSYDEKEMLGQKYIFLTKMKEIYLGEKLTDLSWSISDEDK